MGFRCGAVTNAPLTEPTLVEVLLVELVLVLLDDELVVEELVDVELVDVLLLVELDEDELDDDELDDDELVEVEEVELLVLEVVVGTGQVQSCWQRMAPLGLPGGQLTLPGGSQSSPGSIISFPHWATVEEVEVEVVVTVTEVAVLEGTVVVVVVVTAHEAQQSCWASTLPPSSTQRLADRSMSHLGGRGQSWKPVQKREGSFTQRDLLVSHGANLGSSHATAPSRPQIDCAAQLTILPWQVCGMACVFARSCAAWATHSTYLPWLRWSHGQRAASSSMMPQRAESHATPSSPS